MPARLLIVNADDFGLSEGVNRGIITAHEQGIVTSASLMVSGAAAGPAAAYARRRPQLDLGLHVDLGEWRFAQGEWIAVYHVVPLDHYEDVALELERQLDAFRSLVGRNPTHIDSHQHVNARERILEVLKSLSDERRVRFLRLRARCVEMQRIANAVRGETRDDSGAAAELRTPALDRLLWVFLKLLLSDQAISRFLKAADQTQIQRSLAELEVRVAKRTAAVPEADRAGDRILRSLLDSVATAQLRKENIAQAQGNAELVQAELDRLESKIQALSEMSVSNADPDDMSSKIDAIADGMSQTEDTIRQLQSITGVAADRDPPSIMSADLASAKADA